MALPDREPPPWLGERRLTNLYVESDVLKRSGSDALYGQWESGYPRRVPWEQMRATVDGVGPPPPHMLFRNPRAVILRAPAGHGKTVLAMATARQLAGRSLEVLNSGRAGPGEVPLAMFAPLARLAESAIRAADDKDAALREVLREVMREQGCPDESAGYVAAHTREQRAWLLLDGLDEVDCDDPTLADVLGVLSRWQCKMVITSRPEGFAGRRLPFDVSEYPLAPFSREQVERFVTSWFPAPADRDAMTGLVRGGTPMAPLCRSPLVLTALCRLAERHWLRGRGEPPDRLTRTDVFDLMLRDMPGLMPGGGAFSDEGGEGEWLPALAEAALHVFGQSAGRRPVPRDTLLDLLLRGRNRPFAAGRGPVEKADPDSRRQAGAVLDVLLRERLLLPRGADPARLVFTCRSVLEFLAARALAGPVNASGGASWDRFVPVAGRPWTIGRWIEGKSWLPEWEPVVTYLAGQLADPLPLCEILADPARDDHFRSRLCLLARCLPELPAEPAHPSEEEKLPLPDARRLRDVRRRTSD